MSRLQELGQLLDDARKLNLPKESLIRQIRKELDKEAISKGIAPRYASAAYAQNTRPRAGR